MRIDRRTLARIWHNNFSPLLYARICRYIREYKTIWSETILNERRLMRVNQLLFTIFSPSFSLIRSTSFTTAAYGSHQNVFIRLDPLGRPPSVNSGSYATIASLNKYPLSEYKKSCKFFSFLFHFFFFVFFWYFLFFSVPLFRSYRNQIQRIKFFSFFFFFL